MLSSCHTHTHTVLLNTAKQAQGKIVKEGHCFRFHCFFFNQLSHPLSCLPQASLPPAGCAQCKEENSAFTQQCCALGVLPSVFLVLFPWEAQYTKHYIMLSRLKNLGSVSTVKLSAFYVCIMCMSENTSCRLLMNHQCSNLYAWSLPPYVCKLMWEMPLEIPAYNLNCSQKALSPLLYRAYYSILNSNVLVNL